MTDPEIIEAIVSLATQVYREPVRVPDWFMIDGVMYATDPEDVTEKVEPKVPPPPVMPEDELYPLADDPEDDEE